MEFLNALVALTNFVFIPATAYGSQLALGALGVTLIYGILRFSNFAHGDTMAFGTMATILVTWWFQSMGIGFGDESVDSGQYPSQPGRLLQGPGISVVTSRPGPRRCARPGP